MNSFLISTKLDTVPIFYRERLKEYAPAGPAGSLPVGGKPGGPVGVDVGSAVGNDVGVDVDVVVGVAVTGDVAVAVGVGIAHVARVIVLVSNVTAAVRAYRLPSNTAPV